MPFKRTRAGFMVSPLRWGRLPGLSFCDTSPVALIPGMIKAGPQGQHPSQVFQPAERVFKLGPTPTSSVPVFSFAAALNK